MNSGKETDNKGVNNRCRANTRGGNQAKRTNGGEEGRARLKTGLLPPSLALSTLGVRSVLLYLTSTSGRNAHADVRTHHQLTCRHTELRGETKIAVVSTPNYLKGYRKLGVRSSPHLALCQRNRRTRERPDSCELKCILVRVICLFSCV